MNREIKFRLWNRWNKEMQTAITNEYGDMILRYECMEDGLYMQYTGIKDKNGVEIYEGDIVKDTTPFVEHIDPLEVREIKIWEVVWLEDVAGFGFITLDHKYIEADQLGERRLEVIGNIYGNPELLEE